MIVVIIYLVILAALLLLAFGLGIYYSGFNIGMISSSLILFFVLAVLPGSSYFLVCHFQSDAYIEALNSNDTEVLEIKFSGVISKINYESDENILKICDIIIENDDGETLKFLVKGNNYTIFDNFSVGDKVELQKRFVNNGWLAESIKARNVLIKI